MKAEENYEKNDAAFLYAVMQGLKDVEEGRVVSLEAVKAHMGADGRMRD